MAADRQMAIDLVAEAVAAGARRFKACTVLGIDARTLQRWKKALQEKNTLHDQRKTAAVERVPANKLSDEERQAILAVCKRKEYPKPATVADRAAIGRSGRVPWLGIKLLSGTSRSGPVAPAGQSQNTTHGG